ncbi:MAG: hypothetical protein F6K50_03080 [Moorea sp. SIO3I7]|uniref:hypothetical protein n=1 Tax=Moorena sp. SIO3I8 TaxID=2607833 RepID=UPI0013C230CB|nr:hypothetical protein [Moorena sp. SIO3I8]NEN94544.1 hypothetical protein [Moorena sp. SIO3I7]NEO06965.1 hypothetical protein [Moorena sp. SIO3I8]
MRNSDVIVINGRNSNQINDTEINQINGTQDDDNITQGTENRDHIYALGGADTIVGSVGGDTIDVGYDDDPDYVKYDNFSQRTDQIINFDPNDEDSIYVKSDLFSDLVDNEGLNSDANFEDRLQIYQLGSDAYIRVDPDGLQGNTPFRTLATLKNVDTNDLTIDIVDGDFIIG